MDWIAIICTALLIIIALPSLLYGAFCLATSLSIRSLDKEEKKSHDEFESDWNTFMRKK